MSPRFKRSRPKRSPSPPRRSTPSPRRKQPEHPPDYELRAMTINPHIRNPAISIILTSGESTNTTTTTTTLEKFAHDFGFTIVSIRGMLRSLLDIQRQSDTPIPDEFGLLHPFALEELVREGKSIPAFFLVPILKIRIDEQVCLGRKKFLITGMGEGDEFGFAERLEKEIAIPSAVISFRCIGKEVPPDQIEVDEYYSEIVLRVDVDDASKMYGRLLGAVYEKAITGRKKNGEGLNRAMQVD